jgi:hypothetical protein
MTFEVDPDLRLYTRLTLGRGWRLVTTLTLWTIGIVGLMSGFITPFSNRRVPGDPGFLPIALLLLMIGPSRAAARLLDLERGGLLDQTRLCGRPPYRVLLAFVVGSTWPLLLVAAVMLGSHRQLQPSDLWLAVLVFLLALDIALIVYGTLPPDMAPDSRFVAPLLFIVAIGGLTALSVLGWIAENGLSTQQFDRGEQVTLLVALAALPAAGWLAVRRIERPSVSAGRSGAQTFTEWLARLIPRLGPPEFQRQLRRGLLSGGALVTVVAAPLAVLAGVYFWRAEFALDFRPLALNAVAYAVVLVGAFAVSMTVRTEIESATVELVRLTPQTPEAVTLSWYTAIALPFWIASLLAAVALRVAAPDAFVFNWALVAIAFMWPAFSLAEGFQQRKPGTYLWLPLMVIFAVLIYTLALSVGVERLVPSPRRWAPRAEPWVAVLTTFLALGAASGRMRRRDGPALVGAAAVAAVAAVGLSLRTPVLHALAFPRVAPGVLALLASFAAEERDRPTSPWTRVGIAASAAFASAALIVWQQGATPSASATTGVCAALALSIGILVHERWWRIPALSFGLRAAVMLALLQPWLTYRMILTPGRSAAQTIPDMSQMRSLVGPAEVAILVVVFLAVAFAHARWRARAVSRPVD